LTTSVTSTTGSVEKGTANNETVTTPSLGLVVPSSNWDGDRAVPSASIES